jgi:hypothetical protein
MSRLRHDSGTRARNRSAMATRDPHNPPPGTERPNGRSVICPACGTENRANRLFCAGCGVYLRGDDDTWEEYPPSGWPTAAVPSGADVRRPVPSAPTQQVMLQWDTLPPPSEPPPPLWSTPSRSEAAPVPLGPPSRAPGPRRRNHGLGIVLFLLLAVAVAVAGASLYVVYIRGAEADVTTTSSSAPSTQNTQPSETTSPSQAPDTTTPEPAPPGEGVLLAPLDAGASSTLPPEGGNSYDPENLLDGDLETAWSEGADGIGEGEWVEMTFERSTTLTALEIANGYQKDRRRFDGNPRVDELRLEFSDGTTQNVRLYDDMGWQYITPEPMHTESLRLIIVSVYPGDTWDDTSLSEIRLVGLD